MCNMSKLVKYVFFAEDTNMCYTNSNNNRLNEKVCNMLDKIYKWFAVNKLTLNIYKSNYILFGNRMLRKYVNIKIRNYIVETVKITKC